MYEQFIKKFASDEAYYSDFDFVTNSQLGLIKKSPATYDFFRNNPNLRPETKALNFGRAFHMCMLEPDKFDNRVVKEPEGINKRTKAGKEEYSQFLQENKDNTVLSSGEYKSLMGMRNRLFSAHECMEYLSGGESEVVSVWKDEDTDMLCKCKADYFIKDKKILVDIKTTQDAGFYGFRGSAYKYGYDRQSAFYGDGFKAEEFVFIVIEKTAPYNIGFYQTSEEFREEGRQKYKELLQTYKDVFIEELINPYEVVHSGVL
jgi:hypothetical protein